MSFTYEDAMKALRAADAAGNAEDARRLAQIAAGLKGKARPGVMAQVNRGIADAAGGLVDFLNPFDEPHALNPFPEGTGSARSGLTGAMGSAGIRVAEGDTQTPGEAFARGVGSGAASLVPIAKGLQALRGMGGAVGAFADDAVRALSSYIGAGSEVVATGISEAAQQSAENQGAPEWAQQVAGIAAPMAVPGAVAGAGGALSLAGRMPLGATIRQGARSAMAAAAPYTKSGAEEVASRRLVELAGGSERAGELRSRITADNPLNLTPAQQTGDPNMLAVEQLAAAQDPNIREALSARASASRQAAERGLAVAGSIEDTRGFFADRRRAFAADLKARADDAINRTTAGVEGIGPIRTESENSLQVSSRLQRALEEATMQEKALWDSVPMGVQVPTVKARETAQRLIEETPRAQQNDIPRVVRDLLGSEEGFGDAETVREMHGLYSELRRVARSAMAGNDQNKNLARIANNVADAILEDLGAVDASTTIGRSINEARAFSAALHETFDRGAVGRLQKRTIDGDMSVEPELALKRTVGRGGVEGAVSSRQIEEAAPGTRPFVTDYLKQRFQEATVTPTGEFNNRSAQKFLRDNRELLDRYPELRKDVTQAVQERDNADAFAARIQDRITALQDARRSAGAAVLSGPPSSAIRAFTEAQNPVRAARLIVNEARKDTSGQALAGVKALLSDELISRSGMTGDGISATFDNPKLRAAFRQVFTESEMSRMQTIARELRKLDASQTDAPSIGTSLSGASPNKAIEYLARVIAARQGADLGGGGGGSLQTAQMASSRVKEILGRLTADRASAMLAEAVQDPELFKALLSDLRNVKAEKQIINRALPFLIGGVAATASE